MNPQDPLEQLRGIHMPDAISIWPPAPGWWILAIVVLLFLYGLYRLFKYLFAKRRAKKQLRQVFLDIELQWIENQNHQQLLVSLSALLRRVMLLHYPREAVAALSGKQWLEKLDEVNASTDFSQGAGKVLESGMYAEKINFDADELLVIVKAWLTVAYKQKKIKSTTT